MKRKLILSLSTLVTVFVPVLSVVACEFEDYQDKGYDEDLITAVKDEINAWFFYGRESDANGNGEIIKLEENKNGGFDSSKTEQGIDAAIASASTKDLNNLGSVFGLDPRLAVSAIKLNGVVVDWKVKFKKQSHDYDVENAIGARYEVEIRLSKGTSRNQFVHINVDSSDYVPYIETRESNYADVLAVKRNIDELINDDKSSLLLASDLDLHVGKWYSFENSVSVLKLNFAEVLNDTSRFRTRDSRISFRLSNKSASGITGHTNSKYDMEFKVEKGSEQTYAFYESVDSEKKTVYSAITFTNPESEESSRVSSSVLLDGTDYKTNIINRSNYLPSDFIKDMNGTATPEQLGVNLGVQTQGITKTEIVDLEADDVDGSITGKIKYNDSDVSTNDIEIFGFRTVDDQLDIARDHFSTFVGNKDLRINSQTPTLEQIEKGIVGFNDSFKRDYLKGMTYTFNLSNFSDDGLSTGSKQKCTVTFTHTASSKTTSHSFFVVNNVFSYKVNELTQEKLNVLTRFSEGNRSIAIDYLPSEITKVNNVLDKEMLGLTSEIFANTTFEIAKASEKFGTIQALASTKIGSETTKYFVTFKELRTSSQVEQQKSRELEILARNIRSLNGSEIVNVDDSKLNDIHLPSDLASATDIDDLILEQFVIPSSKEMETKVVWENWNKEDGLSVRIMLSIDKTIAYSRVYKVKG